MRLRHWRTCPLRISHPASQNLVSKHDFCTENKFADSSLLDIVGHHSLHSLYWHFLHPAIAHCPGASCKKMDFKNIRRKDTTKGPPLRILSLGMLSPLHMKPLYRAEVVEADGVRVDGGGVRGYSMLILLQELMYRTYVECEGKAPRRDQIPKPCEHFDLIAGTGTGGLIAIMLGRLRLDIETCKEVYVRMTRRVFETDKTIAGIPYRSTLFKASKLEEAIRDCVKEHTIFEDEGNDGVVTGGNNSMLSPLSPVSAISGPQRSASRASTSTTGAYSPGSGRGPIAATRWGNPDAYLYDMRENRTKT